MSHTPVFSQSELQQYDSWSWDDLVAWAHRKADQAEKYGQEIAGYFSEAHAAIQAGQYATAVVHLERIERAQPVGMYITHHQVGGGESMHYAIDPQKLAALRAQVVAAIAKADH